MFWSASSENASSNTLTFLPEIEFTAALPPGRFWLPMEGRFADRIPTHGQVVIISQGIRNLKRVQ